MLTVLPCPYYPRATSSLPEPGILSRGVKKRREDHGVREREWLVVALGVASTGFIYSEISGLRNTTNKSQRGHKQRWVTLPLNWKLRDAGCSGHKNNYLKWKDDQSRKQRTSLQIELKVSWNWLQKREVIRNGRINMRL